MYDEKTVQERLYQKGQRSTTNSYNGAPCLEFTGGARGVHKQIRVNGLRRGVHRVAYELAFGPIPEGLDVCHHCDNPPCFETSHLFLGTAKQNAEDRERKGRGNAPRGEQNGSARLTEAAVRTIRALYTSGAHSMQKLAALFDVSVSVIWKVVHYEAWAHVA